MPTLTPDPPTPSPVASVEAEPDAAAPSRGFGVSRGAGASFILALLLLIAGLYFYFVPIVFPGKDGTLFGCASAASPPTEAFPKSACLELPKINAYRAYALFASALLVAGLGALFFGVTLPKRDARGADDLDDDDDF